MQLPPPDVGPGACSTATTSPSSHGEELRRTRTAHADDLPGPDLVAEPAPQGRGHRRRGPRHLEDRRRRRSSRRRSTRCARRVGLDPALQRGRRPHQFSGGQCQRISIARAVVTEPKLIICDEPVSALDVSVQAQILNLLEDMKTRYGLTLIFIAHDLAVVKNVSDRVVGHVPRQDLRGRPARRALRAARAPVHRGAARRDPGARPEHPARRDARGVGGEIPSPVAPPSGLPLPHPLPEGAGQCADEEPQIREVAPGPVRRVPLPARAGRDAPDAQRLRVARELARELANCAGARGSAGRRCSCSPASCRPRS